VGIVLRDVEPNDAARLPDSDDVEDYGSLAKNATGSESNKSGDPETLRTRCGLWALRATAIGSDASVQINGLIFVHTNRFVC
jgi:hypothetical protein